MVSNKTFHLYTPIEALKRLLNSVVLFQGCTIVARALLINHLISNPISLVIPRSYICGRHCTKILRHILKKCFNHFNIFIDFFQNLIDLHSSLIIYTYFRLQESISFEEFSPIFKVLFWPCLHNLIFQHTTLSNLVFNSNTECFYQLVELRSQHHKKCGEDFGEFCLMTRSHKGNGI